MTLRSADFYSERALDDRKGRTSERMRARKVREALVRQYDTMLSPKKIRSILRIVPSAAPKSTS